VLVSKGIRRLFVQVCLASVTEKIGDLFSMKRGSSLLQTGAAERDCRKPFQPWGQDLLKM